MHYQLEIRDDGFDYQLDDKALLAALKLQAKGNAEKERELRERAQKHQQTIASNLDPLRSFHEQLSEEVESYERLKRGELGEIKNLHGLGTALVALRIALGLTQRELAERLDVHESQVSRDERNEYHAITVNRASRILDALGVDLRSAFYEPVAVNRKSDPPLKPHVEEIQKLAQ